MPQSKSTAFPMPLPHFINFDEALANAVSEDMGDYSSDRLTSIALGCNGLFAKKYFAEIRFLQHNDLLLRPVKTKHLDYAYVFHNKGWFWHPHCQIHSRSVGDYWSSAGEKFNGDWIHGLAVDRVILHSKESDRGTYVTAFEIKGSVKEENFSGRWQGLWSPGMEDVSLVFVSERLIESMCAPDRIGRQSLHITDFGLDVQVS